MNNNYLEVYEEVHCVAFNGSNIRVDIFSIDHSKKLGYILDPTVRFDTYDEVLVSSLEVEEQQNIL